MYRRPLQEEILEETAGLDGPMLAPTPPSTPKNSSEATPPPASTPKTNSEAKDANPWEASWGDLLSSQESDSEFDTDSSQSRNSGASTADAADSGLQAGASGSSPSDAQAEATGSSLINQINKIKLLIFASIKCNIMLSTIHVHSMDVACCTT